MRTFLDVTRFFAGSLLLATLAAGCAPAPGDEPAGSDGAALSHSTSGRSSDRVKKAVAQLESEKLLPGPGRNDDYSVKGGDALDMVKGYIKAKYADDTDIGDAYKFESDGSGLRMDEEIAGTLSTSVAIREALDSVKGWYSEESDAQGKAHIAKVRAALEEIVAAGATFGFDGFEQNACAAPTAFLLVLDRAGNKVYGVDLNPCEE